MKVCLYEVEEPSQWVLWVGEAAWLAGAENVMFEFGPFRTVASFDGLTLGHEDLVGLSKALVLGRGDADEDDNARRRRVVSQLALIPSAIHGWTEIVSDDGSGESVKAHITQGGDLRVETTPSSHKLAHTRVKVVTSAMGRYDEDRLLRERCRWSGIQIEINNEVISEGPEGFFDEFPAEPKVYEVQNMRDDELGLVANSDAKHQAELQLLARGIAVEVLHIPGGQQGVVAFVDADLERAIGGYQVYRSPEVDALLGRVLALHDSVATTPARPFPDSNWANPERRLLVPLDGPRRFPPRTWIAKGPLAALLGMFLLGAGSERGRRGNGLGDDD